MDSQTNPHWQEYGGKSGLHDSDDDGETWDEFGQAKDVGKLDEFGQPKKKKKVKRPWYVIPESYVCRQVWNLVLVFLLVYTGTIFPYRLVFVELNLQGNSGASPFWDTFGILIDILFYIDLLAWFFFTFRSRTSGKEVFEIDRIVVRYLKTYFWVNLVACIPPQVFGKIFEEGFNKTARLSRLQRMSRLARLTRIIRLAKLFECSSNHIWRRIQSFRYVRILNFVVGLFWVVHLVACGWYLTAWFHEDHQVTWVARRGIMDAGPFDQWIHANYFVLTVFTTVGFGDMYAVTLGEIFYVIFTFLIGAIVYSIIMSEVMNILLSVDQSQVDQKAQADLLQSFTAHAKLDDHLSQDLVAFFDCNKSRRHEIDRTRLNDLLTSYALPRELMENLAGGLFDGELEVNSFMTSCLGYEAKLAARFPLLLALALNERDFARKEMVYLAYDHPYNIFLVMKGTFAYIAFPSPRGGLAELPQEVKQSLSSIKLDGSKTIWMRSMKSKIESFKQYNHAKGVLFPYQLFGARTYFGDLELLASGGHSRFSGARCESECGQVLVLHKNDLFKLAHDFRRCGYAWRCMAKRRDEHRRLLMSRLTEGRKVEHFAATTIQCFFRFRHGLSDGLDHTRLALKLEEDISPRTNHSRSISAGSHDSDTDDAEKFEKRFQSFRHEMHSSLDLIRQEIRSALMAMD